VDLLIRLCFFAKDEYGKAEFQPGMEEVDEKPIAITTSIAAPENTKVPVVIMAPNTEASSVEGYSILQKGLFLAVILGCVAGYLRMNQKRDKRFMEKSMA
jgi:hypothetical protein